MQVWNLLRAARWKYSSQKLAKNRHLGAIAQICRAISSQLRHVLTIGKKLLSSNISPTCPPQYCALRPTSGWDRSGSLGHPSSFQRLSRVGIVTARQSSSQRQPNFAALRQRAPLMFGRATITLGIGPHSIWVKVCFTSHSSGHKIGHFGDVLPGQSLSVVLKKLNLTQQRQTTQEQYGLSYKSRKKHKMLNLNKHTKTKT